MKRIGGTTKKWMMIGLLCGLFVAAYTTITWAGPPQGVTATLIGRATYSRFKVKTPESEGAHNNGQVSLDFMAQAKPGMDMVVRTFDYLPGSTTGWHTAPWTGFHQCHQ